MARTPPQPLPAIPRADEILPITRRHIAEHQRVASAILASVTAATACFDNVVRPLVELENAQKGEAATIRALKYCSPSRAVQDAVEAAEVAWPKQDPGQRRGLYVLLKAVQTRGEPLDGESQKLVDRLVLECEDDGLGVLDEAGIRRRQERDSRIQALCNAFARNLRQTGGGGVEDDADGLLFTAEEVDGLPPGDRAPARADGKAYYGLHKHGTVLRHAHNPETRRRMFLAHHRRCPENKPLFREVVLLRDENARELGAANHAATKLPYRMAASMEEVEALMGRVADALIPHARAAFDEVDAFRRRCLQKHAAGSSEGADSSAPMPPWDYLYYSTQLDQEKQTAADPAGPADPASLSEYFPLRHTVDSILAVYADCLQLRFEPLARDDLATVVWHADVTGWAVWDDRDDSRDTFVGYLLADILSRPNKHRGCMSVNLQPGFRKPDGTRMHPVNTIMCHYHLSPSRGYLLSPHQVATLFHELGHSVHDMIGRSTYARFHGSRASTELSEGIGMMMEQWAWIPDVLRTIGRHYTRVDPAYMAAWQSAHPGGEPPPETIPDTLLEQRMRRHASGRVSKILGILMSVLFDLAVHNPASRADLLQADVGQLHRAIFEKLTFRRLPEDTWSYAAERSVLTNYDAAFYSYICAEIFAADVFQTTFADDPLSRTAWKRFREGILEPGGSRDDAEMVTAFLGGRPADPEALFSVLGIPSGAS